jgi:hypothetical protein
MARKNALQRAHYLHVAASSTASRLPILSTLTRPLVALGGRKNPCLWPRMTERPRMGRYSASMHVAEIRSGWPVVGKTGSPSFYFHL